MHYDNSMNATTPRPGEPHEPRHTTEQLYAIKSLDAPPPAATPLALSKSSVFATTVVGFLVASVFWRFIDPDLAWVITFVPGIIGAIYTGRHSSLGRPPFSKKGSIMFVFLNGVLLGAAVWSIAHIARKHHLL
jgi:hypothetical protein